MASALPKTGSTAPNTPENRSEAPGAAAPVPHHDFIPIWLLILVFVFVELSVVWLMYPKWEREKTRFWSIRHQQKGDYDKAVPYLEQLVKTNPDHPTYLAELANAYLNLNQLDKALDYYLQARANRSNLRTEEDSGIEVPDFSNVIGKTYYLKGDMANAEKYLTEALQTDKLDRIAAFTLGELEFKRKNYRKSTEYFKIVASDPAYKDRVQEYYSKIEQEVFGSLR